MKFTNIDEMPKIIRSTKKTRTEMRPSPVARMAAAFSNFRTESDPAANMWSRDIELPSLQTLKGTAFLCHKGYNTMHTAKSGRLRAGVLMSALDWWTCGHSTIKGVDRDANNLNSSEDMCKLHLLENETVWSVACWGSRPSYI